MGLSSTIRRRKQKGKEVEFMLGEVDSRTLSHIIRYSQVNALI